jgi:transposase-like protein
MLVNFLGDPSAQRAHSHGADEHRDAATHRDTPRCQGTYPAMGRQLEKDLPELLSFFSFPRHLWRQLRAANLIERCFVEVRRRT